MKRLKINKGYNKVRALSLWDEVVEPELSAYAVPRNVKNGILYVVTPNDVWAAQFSARKHAYLRQINDLLGTGKLRGITFTISRTPAMREFHAAQEKRPVWLDMELTVEDEKEIAERLAEIEDPELKKSIAGLLEKDIRFRLWKKKQGWRDCRDCGTLIEEGNRCAFCRVRRSGRL
ncbi:MAG: DUF721 domain-containing protein [Chloroflexi bacterium]|nr:DUF721 domain-containing protein [Chloroflexota bacterium]